MKKEEQLMKSIIIKYSKYILTLLAVAAMAVGLLMPAQIKAADSYNCLLYTSDAADEL